MTAQHTPGPWTTKELQVYAENGNGSTIAHVYDPSRNHDHSEAAANALLIAKAPELLEGLRNIVKMLDGSQPKDPVGALMAARYLVHLATGDKL